MGFARTRTAFGGYDIRDGRPRMTTVSDAMVVGWALYDDRRLLVPDSAFTREGIQSGRRGLTTIGAETTTDLNITSGRRLPEDDYLWVGHIHDHFGHFLVSTLSRFWALSRPSNHARIIAVGPGDLQRRLRLPFVAAVLDALGLAEDRFVEVSDRDIIPSIAVPEALFVENSAAYRVMSTFCTRLADKIVAQDGKVPEAASSQPLFLTKRNLSSGVRTIENEAVFTDHLADAGIAVASPEQLSLAEQIRLWQRHSLIAAFEGSALHAAMFVCGKKILSLSSNPFAPSNQVLIDAIGGHQALYLNCGDAIAEAPTRPGFSSTLRLTDPRAAADAVIRAMTYLQAGDHGMRMRSMQDTVSPWLFLDEPFGSNLSRGKPADMSSIDPTWAKADDTRREAAGAVSGRLTGSYQIHSGPEQRPWWNVDLCMRCLVTEIRIYNRNDVAMDRARHLVLSYSNDGASWAMLTRRVDSDDFGGGAKPKPWRWWNDFPFEARFIRISLEGPTFLHLDQVEVFGIALSDDMPVSF